MSVGTAAVTPSGRATLPGVTSAPARTGIPVAALGPGALAGVAVALGFGFSAQLPAWLWAVAIGVPLAAVDLREHRLPNRLLAIGAAGGAALLLVAAAVDGAWPALVRAGLAALVAFAVLLGMALLAPAGLGMGDVKLAGLLGLSLGWLGWPVLLLGLLLGFVAQALVGVVLLLTRRAGRRTELAFGPALLGGSLAAALLAAPWPLSGP
ncbi:MAG: Peptidase prepilin type [Modestobacter sp.]|nr:Peptidase prepilin type [Modestobacter sp.]